MSAKKIIFFLCVILFAMNNMAFALEEQTHSYLNGGIARNWWNGFPLDSYLKNNLNISGGVQNYYNGEQVWNWIADGGVFEDEPMYTRSMNHFHDPLKDWGSAGFKGVGNSSAVWAQYPLQSQPINGYFSWNDVRSYYYWALTAPSDTSQANFYSLCFRGLGQLMHLIQDASVPAHTRNDFHYVYNYEDWVESMRTSKKPAEQAQFTSIVNTPALPLSPYLLSRVGYNPYATIPVAGLFDTDSYNGTNPGITPFDSVGLAEYSNANFFSEDTIFSDYPYPAYSSATIMDLPVGTDQGMTIYRPYYYKSGEGDAGYPLATDGFLGWYVHNYIPSYDYVLLTNLKDQALDEQCYDAYARRLLPDAIAYSSALLQYFFRGQIDAIDAAATTGTDDSGNSVITGMTLKVKNNTPSEDIYAVNNSHLVVSYSYQDSTGSTVYGKSGERQSHRKHPFRQRHFYRYL